MSLGAFCWNGLRNRSEGVGICLLNGVLFYKVLYIWVLYLLLTQKDLVDLERVLVALENYLRDTHGL